MFDKITALYRSRNKQTGQGMVEFGLVIPILLLLMLGIIAFGHLFFSYTLVVAASREAARFGIATGLSDTNLPRFRDCDAIRAAAVRAGSFSGVTPEKVTVWYDTGPCDTEGCVPEVVGTCPIGGIGPGNIDIGDRIVINVLVDYEPIVPIGWIPEMPLQSRMARTLIRSMPIGDDQFTSDDNSIATVTRIRPQPPARTDLNQPVTSWSYVSEVIPFEIDVIDAQPGIGHPEGTVKFFIEEYDPLDTTAYDYETSTPDCTEALATSVTFVTCSMDDWSSIETYIIRAIFISANEEAYKSSKAEPWIHYVE